MKRLFSFVLTLILCASLAAPALADGENIGQIITAKYGASPDNALYSAAATAPSAPGFGDVPIDHNFYSAIMDCAELGIIGGYGDGTFRPTNTVSRSNFTVMLSRTFYPDDITKYSTDYYLSRGMFFPNYMAMEMNNVLTDTSFRYAYDSSTEMSKGITRYDMAQLIANIMRNKGFSANESEKTEAAAQITDYNAIPSQYQDAVANVYALGVIGGYSDGSFSGEVTMNRGQAAVVISRMMQYALEQPEIPPVVEPVDPTPIEPEKPVEPEQPETPVETPETPVAGKTLANGKAITEDNVSEILAQLQAKYPNGTNLAQGYAGLNTGRYPNQNCIYQIVSQYTMASGRKCSTTAGCGGWAACVADEIWGQRNVTWRKTTLTDIRPGDLMIRLDDNGYLAHVQICTGYVNGFDTTVKVRVASASSAGATRDYAIGWANCVTMGLNFDVYTAYPA